jgi:hypothetical protein
MAGLGIRLGLSPTVPNWEYVKVIEDLSHHPMKKLITSHSSSSDPTQALVV